MKWRKLDKTLLGRTNLNISVLIYLFGRKIALIRIYTDLEKKIQPPLICSGTSFSRHTEIQKTV